MVAIAGALERARVGVWFGNGLDNALAARAALSELKVAHPNADWVVFGPSNSFFLFEMDGRVPVYISLKNLEARRAAQTRLSYYLETRAQFKKLRSLRLTTCLGISVLSPVPSVNKLAIQQFKHVQKMLNVNGVLVQKSLPEYLAAERPLLQAGPQALAFATQLYRKIPPHLNKVVVLLHLGGSWQGLDAQWVASQRRLVGFGITDHVTVAVIVADDRLSARRLNKTQPTWLQVNQQQAMGLVTYADQVICTTPQFTQICVEMGRSDRLVLVNSHS